MSCTLISDQIPVTDESICLPTSVPFTLAVIGIKEAYISVVPQVLIVFSTRLKDRRHVVSGVLCGVSKVRKHGSFH